MTLEVIKLIIEHREGFLKKMKEAGVSDNQHIVYDDNLFKILKEGVTEADYFFSKPIPAKEDYDEQEEAYGSCGILDKDYRGYDD